MKTRITVAALTNKVLAIRSNFFRSSVVITIVNFASLVAITSEHTHHMYQFNRKVITAPPGAFATCYGPLASPYENPAKALCKATRQAFGGQALEGPKPWWEALKLRGKEASRVSPARPPACKRLPHRPRCGSAEQASKGPGGWCEGRPPA